MKFIKNKILFLIPSLLGIMSGMITGIINKNPDSSINISEIAEITNKLFGDSLKLGATKAYADVPAPGCAIDPSGCGCSGDASGDGGCCP